MNSTFVDQDVFRERCRLAKSEFTDPLKEDRFLQRLAKVAALSGSLPILQSSIDLLREFHNVGDTSQREHYRFRRITIILFYFLYCLASCYYYHFPFS